MIDEKKIEEAQEEIFEDKFHFNGEYVMMSEGDSEPHRVEMYDDGQIKEAFKAGAHWAIDEFLKDLWHDASEEPDVRHRIIMCLYKEGDICQDNDVYDEATEHDRHKLRIGEFDWVYYAEENNIEKWCYKDDLLSRKGE